MIDRNTRALLRRRCSAAACVSLVALIMLSLGVHAAAADSCQLKEEISLDIDMSRRNRIVVPGTIDGHAVRLIVDTGSAITSSLFQPTVTAFGLIPRKLATTFATVTGKPITEFVDPSSFMLGNKSFEATRLLVWPASGDSGVAGLIGPEILRRYDLEFDPADGKLNFFSQDHCPGNVVYWTRDATEAPVAIKQSGHVVISMQLDGKPIDALIDTGSPDTLLSLRTARSMFDLERDSAGVTELVPPTGAPPPILKRYRYPFKSLLVGGLKINNPDIVMIDDKMEKRGDIWADQSQLYSGPSDERLKLPDLTLGMNILGRLRFYIAYGEQHFYVSAANAH